MHSQLSATNYSQQQLHALVHECLQSLNWKITLMNQSGLVAQPFPNLVFVYRFENVPLVSCHYKSTEELAYTNEPEKVIAAFEAKFDEMALQFNSEKLDEVYSIISKVFKTEEKTDNDGWIKSLLTVFTPAKDYFAAPILLNANILVFVLMVAAGAGFFDPSTAELLKWGANYRRLTLDGDWWRLITSNFVHIGVFHLAMNMYALVFAGIFLEPIIGRTKFAFGYLLTGVVAALVSLWWNTNTISAGASGAIFGLYGIFFALLLTNFIERQARMTLLISIAIFIFYNLASGVKSGIDNAAHIGGLASGIIIGFIFYLSLMMPDKRIISVLSVIFPSTLVVAVSFILLHSITNPIKKYDENILAFSHNENTAIKALSKYQSLPDKEYLTLIADSSLGLWKKNLIYLEELKSLDLPDYLKYRNELLKEYSVLRIEETSWIYVSVEQQTNIYDSKIDSIQKKINSVLKKINADE